MLAAALFALAISAPPTVNQRWVYLATNLLVDANVASGIQMLSRAQKLGYNGVMVADSKFCRWGDFDGRYEANCARFRAAVKKLGMRFIACVAPIGYSNDLLGKDPNLAEGLPVVDAPFVAQGNKLVPEEEHPLKNGGFEEAKGDSPSGWDWVDQPGKICVLDHTDAAEGSTSLRMSDIGKFDPQNGHARAEQVLHLQPFRYYHVSLKVKTKDFETPGSTQILALGATGQALQYVSLPIERTMPWKQVDVTFNTLDNATVNFYIGVWGGKGGTIWWDDVKIEPAGLVNLVRRSGAPFRVTNADGTKTYVEHQDYDGAVDPKMGNRNWRGDFDAWHPGPTLTLAPGSRIRPGDRVKVSYSHTALIYDGQAMICMAEPKTRELLKWQIQQVHRNLAPDGYMLSHDEIRMTGWDRSCVDSGKRPGQLLADNVRFCIDAVKAEDPGKEILVWSDMFDPTHNAQAKGSYYLVKGDGPWSGSWAGLEPGITVVSWQSNPATRKSSLDHFAKLGCHQVLAGYYDGPPDSIVGWLRDAADTPNMGGVMYTTWVGSYKDLEPFAKALGG
ncbi:MAG TPA: hypothetical protein VKT78_19320 [Fimbriimonadaceae bacterium]|nr:hypothetical protein [Fimbriimonadaceae bacterium]